MNDFPLGLAFVLNVVADEEAEQSAREQAWEDKQRMLAAIEKAKKVIPITRRSTMPPPPNRRAA